MASTLRYYVYKKMDGLDMSFDKVIAIFEYEVDANIFVALLNYRYGYKACYMLDECGGYDI